MATYAPRSSLTERRHPKALLLILAGHAALIGAVMTARLDLPNKIRDLPTRVELIPLPQDPPPEPPPPTPRDTRPPLARPIPIVPQPRLDPIDMIPVPLPVPSPGDIKGPVPLPTPQIEPLPDPVRTGPRFATPAHALKPPYPPAKIQRDEEATLRLRLSIDERGRVIAVEPVGPADPAFLDAARRHLIARWRYKPATENGRPVASTTVITLRFELDG